VVLETFTAKSYQYHLTPLPPSGFLPLRSAWAT